VRHGGKENWQGSMLCAGAAGMDASSLTAHRQRGNRQVPGGRERRPSATGRLSAAPKATLTCFGLVRGCSIACLSCTGDMLLEKPLRVCVEDDTDWITLDTNLAFKLQRCFLMASSVERTSAVVMLLLPPPLPSDCPLHRFRHGGIGRSVRTVQSLLALARITHGSPHAIAPDIRGAVPWDFRGGERHECACASECGRV